MKFTIGRTEVKISIAVFLLAAFCIVIGETENLLIAVTALLVHETAHLIAAKNIGCMIARVAVYPFGAVMIPDGFFGRKEGEAVVAVAGPLGSLAFSGMLRITELLFGMHSLSHALMLSSLLVAALNLLPAFPLDGGRIFRSVLLRFASERSARCILFAFTSLTALAMLCTGIWLLIKGVYIWTFLAIPPFLIVSSFREWRVPDAGHVSLIMERRQALRAGIAQKAQIIVIPDVASIGDAIASLSGNRFTILYVLQEGGAAQLDETELIHAAARYGLQFPLKSVICRLTERK